MSGGGDEDGGSLRRGGRLMSELDVLREVTTRLKQEGIPHMLTGSLAMSYYTQPRMTRDIDIVAELREPDAQRVIDLFQPGYYVPAGAIREAIRDRSMFNLIHAATVTKVDFVIRKDDPYRRTEFERRIKVRFGDVDTWLVSKEDLIISKIAWARDSRSEVQRRDVQGLMASGYDRDYVDHWLRQLGISEFAREWLM